jgi:hypothetical protein
VLVLLSIIEYTRRLIVMICPEDMVSGRPLQIPFKLDGQPTATPDSFGVSSTATSTIEMITMDRSPFSFGSTPYHTLNAAAITKMIMLAIEYGVHVPLPPISPPSATSTTSV